MILRTILCFVRALPLNCQEKVTIAILNQIWYTF